MRSNSRLPAAGCMFVHIMCVRSACVGMPGRRSLAALRLHRAFSPVSTTILLRWGWASLCFLAACLRSAVAGLQRSQRDSSSAACADPDGPARPIFLQSAAAPTPSAHFLLFGPAPPDMSGRKKNKHGLLEFTYLLPFPVFCCTIEKKNDLG